MISVSTLRSENSSLSLWFSIRNASLSCSPILISSSSKTPRSIATLYFDSKSSNEDVVCLACLSKSSFCTSMSRILSCNVLLLSRNVVISFCRALCALVASDLDCLYLDCSRNNQSWNSHLRVRGTYLPFLDLKAQSLGFLSQGPLALFGLFDVLLELGLEFFAGGLKLLQIEFNLFVLCFVIS
jgi:hypothetical protein